MYVKNGQVKIKTHFISDKKFTLSDNRVVEVLNT